MEGSLAPRTYLAHEARGLLARLAQIKPIALHETMVPAAALTAHALAAIEAFLAKGRRAVAQDIERFLAWLAAPSSRAESVETLCRAYVLLRLRFHAALSHFDIFSDAITQRSEHGIGVWLAGLDALAKDGLVIEGDYYEAPPVLCYLERGFGAAIRRARTRLPGGAKNPVAVIRIPRERMVGSGIGVSLLHEVGHQAAALLDLVPSLRLALQAKAESGLENRAAWHRWERCMSEVVADLWAISFLGVGATLGLMSVVTLPAPFAFRATDDDPHPMPWVRVMLSCALGQALFPDPQWARLSSLWSGLYPTRRAAGSRQEQIRGLLATMPSLVELLIEHRPERLRGRSLRDVLPVRSRAPARLRALAQLFSRHPEAMRRARPTLLFAAIGQARADGAIGPSVENKTLSHMLSAWALRNATRGSERCVEAPLSSKSIGAELLIGTEEIHG